MTFCIKGLKMVAQQRIACKNKFFRHFNFLVKLFDISLIISFRVNDIFVMNASRCSMFTSTTFNLEYVDFLFKFNFKINLTWLRSFEIVGFIVDIEQITDSNLEPPKYFFPSNSN